MNRLTRTFTLVNLPESRLLATHPRRNPTPRSVDAVSSAAVQIIPPHPHRQRQFPITTNNKRATFTTAAAGRWRPSQHSKAMDASAAEDFVSIDGPVSPVRENPSGADIESLVQSISSVDEGRGDDREEDAAISCVDEGRGDDREEDAAISCVDEGRGDGREGDAATDAGDGGGERKVLPVEFSRNVVQLSCESTADGGICDVFLVGTAHVSQESCQEVEAVIRFLKPQVVFLELCSSRLTILTPQNLKVPTMGEMVDMWKKQHNLFGILYSWFLAKLASKLEVFPGSEFRVAFEEALEYGGKVILGDRPVQITLQRTWAKMPLWHKTKLLYSLVFQAVFLPSPEDLNKMLKEMDDVDMLTLVIQEMSKQFPTLMETLVHERDQYMSSTLLRVASENSSVVAVVGKGHLQGIKKHWKQPIEMKHLLHVDMPSQKPGISATKILTTLGVAVAGVAIISGIFLSKK